MGFLFQPVGADVVSPRSPFYQGPFGRLFPNLPPWRPANVSDDGLEGFCRNVADTLMLEHPPTPGQPIPHPKDVPPPSLTDPDPLDAHIPAGYTYFGQFIDHDITFDPTSSLQRQNDPDKLLNFRTPRLDLDCVYGRGPLDQPYLYSRSSRRGEWTFLTGTAADTAHADLPRNDEGAALIGDPRNDENAIVSQLHLAFLLAHNTLVERAREKGRPQPFEAARRTLRWLYQWLAWFDFVERVTHPGVFEWALRREHTPDGRTVWRRGLEDVYSWREQPFIPVEFAAAAYRFGHSLVRNTYQTNDPHRGAGNFVPVFDNTPPTTGAQNDDLRGFRRIEAKNIPQWDWFLQAQSSGDPFPQRARLVDTKLANALAFLHEGPPGDAANVLAARNLLRGIRLDLPSGTAVAHSLGIDPVALEPHEPDALWYYILKEAAVADEGGARLGYVGSAIVAAVFAGLLSGDPSSWVNQQPGWVPDDDPLLKPGEDNIDGVDGAWTLPAIIRLAGLPMSADDF